MSKVAVAINIQIGHSARVFTKAESVFTHEWSVYVQGENNQQLEFIDRIVFNLHNSFKKPKRVFKDPPFKINELGYGGFNLPIEFYFKSEKEELRKARIEYDLFLQEMNGTPLLSHVRTERIIFFKPSEEFKRKVLACGGEIVDYDATFTSPGRSVNGNSRGVRTTTVDSTAPPTNGMLGHSSSSLGKRQKMAPSEPHPKKVGGKNVAPFVGILMQEVYACTNLFEKFEDKTWLEVAAKLELWKKEIPCTEANKMKILKDLVHKYSFNSVSHYIATFAPLRVNEFSHEVFQDWDMTSKKVVDEVNHKIESIKYFFNEETQKNEVVAPSSSSSDGKDSSAKNVSEGTTKGKIKKSDSKNLVSSTTQKIPDNKNTSLTISKSMKNSKGKLGDKVNLEIVRPNRQLEESSHDGNNNVELCLSVVRNDDKRLFSKNKSNQKMKSKDQSNLFTPDSGSRSNDFKKLSDKPKTASSTMCATACEARSHVSSKSPCVLLDRLSPLKTKKSFPESTPIFFPTASKKHSKTTKKFSEINCNEDVSNSAADEKGVKKNKNKAVVDDCASKDTKTQEKDTKTEEMLAKRKEEAIDSLSSEKGQEVKKPDEFTALFGEAIIRAPQQPKVPKPSKPKPSAAPSSAPPSHPTSSKASAEKEGKEKGSSKESSSRSSSKDKSKGHKDKERDREKDKKKDKKSKDKEKQSSSSKDDDRKSRDKEKERHKSDKSSSERKESKSGHKEESSSKKSSSKSSKDKKEEEKHRRDKSDARKESKKGEAKEVKEYKDKKESSKHSSSSEYKKKESNSKEEHALSSKSQKDKKDKHKDKKKDKSKEDVVRESDIEKSSDKEDRHKKDKNSSKSKSESTSKNSKSSHSSSHSSPASRLTPQPPGQLPIPPLSPIKDSKKRKLSPTKPSKVTSRSASKSPAPKRSPAQYQSKHATLPAVTIPTPSPSPPATKALLPPPAPVAKVAASPKVHSPRDISPKVASPRNAPSPRIPSPSTESYSQKDSKSKRPVVSPSLLSPVPQPRPPKAVPSRSSSSSSNSSRSQSGSRSSSRSRSRSKSKSRSRSRSVSSSSSRSRSRSASGSRSVSSNNRSRSPTPSRSPSPSVSHSPAEDSKSRSRSRSSCSSGSPPRASSGGTSPRPPAPAPPRGNTLSLLLNGMSDSDSDSDDELERPLAKKPKLETKPPVSNEVKKDKITPPKKALKQESVKREFKREIKKEKTISPEPPKVTKTDLVDVKADVKVKTDSRPKKESLFDDNDDSDKDDATSNSEEESESEEIRQNGGERTADVEGFVDDELLGQMNRLNLTAEEKKKFIRGARHCRLIERENGEFEQKDFPDWFTNEDRVFYLKLLCTPEELLVFNCMTACYRMRHFRNYAPLDDIQRILEEHNVAFVNGKTIDWLTVDATCLERINEYVETVGDI